MSIWTVGKKHFVFQAYKGSTLKKSVKTFKLQKQMRLNQLANEQRKRDLKSGKPSKKRRLANSLAREWPLFENNRKKFDPTPTVVPPK